MTIDMNDDAIIDDGVPVHAGSVCYYSMAEAIIWFKSSDEDSITDVSMIVMWWMK
jgi:hypothetical protein